MAAGYLHDVGFAPHLATAAFHPLDGARFVRDAGHERLAGLVAYHSASRAEAEECELGEAWRHFLPEEGGDVADDSAVLSSTIFVWSRMTVPVRLCPSRAPL